MQAFLVYVQKILNTTAMPEVLGSAIMLAAGGLANLILVLCLKQTWRYWTQVSKPSSNSPLAKDTTYTKIKPGQIRWKNFGKLARIKRRSLD